MVKIFSVEGNIGSGKSTFVEYLKQHCSDKFVFLQEPVNIWKEIKDEESGKDKIQLFYEDMKTHAFSFQMMAYISRLSTLKRAIKENPGKDIICERCLYTDKYVFARLLNEDSLISSTDYQIYNRWFSHFIEELPPISYVYIQARPEISLGRIQKRGRDGEDKISLEYLTRVHRKHEDWLKGETCLILNGNDTKEKKEDYTAWFELTLRFMTRNTPMDLFRKMMGGV